MTTYICKCGRIFQKNTEAGTTGFRMPDYGPGHECYGCPFVCEVLTWDPVTQQQAVQNHECRASKTLRYDTTADINVFDKCTANIYTLDFEFLQKVHEFADSILGFEPDRYFFDNRSAVYGADGRYRYTLYPLQNKTGVGAKDALKAHFFNPDGTRKDVAPEQEKEIVLNQIKEAKALAQEKRTPAEVGTVYYHHNLVYFADQRENSKQFTVFMDDMDHPSPDTRTEVATVPDFDTFDEAQNALDGLAIKRGFTTERSTPEKDPETEQSDDDQDGLGPDGMEELAEYEELTQSDAEPASEAPEFGNDGADPENDVDETPDSVDDTGDSVNDQPEEQQGPCDWKNASGADEEDEDDPEDEPEEVSGDPLDLRGDEFDFIVNPANAALNRFVAMLHAKKQHDGEINLKVTFEDEGGSYIFGGAVSGKINLTMKPQKVTGDAVELQFDAQGNPIIPADREHQLSFDELQPGREIPPTGTATVDGKTGIVENYQEDAAEDQAHDDPQGDLPEDEEQPEKLYPCENFDCPFYGLPDDGSAGCCYDQDARDTRDPSIKSDAVDAVHFYRCTRPEVIQAFAEAHPNGDTDFEGHPDTQEDQPPYSDGEEINQEDDAS